MAIHDAIETFSATTFCLLFIIAHEYRDICVSLIDGKFINARFRGKKMKGAKNSIILYVCVQYLANPRPHVQARLVSSKIHY